MPPAAIERALTNPTAPMPSYKAVQPSVLKVLVAYLTHLRSSRPHVGSVVGINAQGR